MNKRYPLGRQRQLEGSIAWLTDTIKVTAVTSAYAQSDAHEFFSSVPAPARKATETLAAKTSTLGVADAGNPTYTGIVAATIIVGFVVWKDTGVEATSPLIAWYDTAEDTTPIAITADGNPMTIPWSASGLFKL